MVCYISKSLLWVNVSMQLIYYLICLSRLWPTFENFVLLILALFSGINLLALKFVIRHALYDEWWHTKQNFKKNTGKLEVLVNMKSDIKLIYYLRLYIYIVATQLKSLRNRWLASKLIGNTIRLFGSTSFMHWMRINSELHNLNYNREKYTKWNISCQK